ncbi:MAG: TetR/AcrR family transcriptional regulator [Deltaproteobacteria bacterium]|nr:TetR/AcrR family transcriptional regulator [Deltaproteobacteria bacterium]MBW2596163.1 TetR/AcrR family transcriptional regulator [Deltaproteobacteria bacterium]MBW2650759.1 TetR/AcrR family transcriptional regulator [Deltaproteobacteria bacterium]
METPLDKARRAPESMKARILTAARRMFGEYGFHGTTTRMIAAKVGIDVSTLHYHWGGKKDLYEAVILDINHDLRQKLRRVERVIRGRPLEERIAISIDQLTDYLFGHSEIPNLILFRYFGRTRDKEGLDFIVPEFISDIVRSMGLNRDGKPASSRSMLEILTIMNSIYGFISGANFFMPMVKLRKKEYIAMVKETLKFIYIPPFAQNEGKAR